MKMRRVGTPCLAGVQPDTSLLDVSCCCGPTCGLPIVLNVEPGCSSPSISCAESEPEDVMRVCERHALGAYSTALCYLAALGNQACNPGLRDLHSHNMSEANYTLKSHLLLDLPLRVRLGFARGEVSYQIEPLGCDSCKVSALW